MQLPTILAQIGAWISIVVLLATIVFILFLQGWKYPFLKYLLLNTVYCIISAIVAYSFSKDSSVYRYFGNLTIPVDLITFLMIFYSFWKNENFKRYLKISIIPVLVTWLVMLMVYGFEKIHFINLLVPAAWSIATAISAFLLVFFSDSEKQDLGTKFLISAGFLFYAFTYFIIETVYLIIKNNAVLNDAWNLNVWSWLISRTILLIGTLYYLYNQKTNYRLKSVLTW